jgi:hypothetical protein
MKNERVEENLTRKLKNGIIISICMVLLLLSACGAEREEARFETFRKTMADSAVTVTAEVTARDGENVTAFTLQCTETDAGYDIEVLAPEEIRGVRAHTDADGVQMQFDDLILPMPQTKGAVSPLMALPLVLSAARTGHLDLVWQEDDLVCQLVTDDSTAVRIYLNDDNTPVAAEADTDGKTCVFCTVTGWSTEKSDLHESNDTDVGGDQS